MSCTAFSEETLRAVFTRLDTSGDGFLSHGELLDGLLHSDLIRGNDSYDARQMLDRCWKLAETNLAVPVRVREVSVRECWVLIGATRSPTETELKRAYAHFKAIDVSGDGVLDRLEVLTRSFPITKLRRTDCAYHSCKGIVIPSSLFTYTHGPRH